MTKIRFFLIFLLFGTYFGFGQLDMPSFFGDNMVLQQQSKVSFWGTDTPNSTIQIRGSWGTTSVTNTDDKGQWRIQLQTPAAGGPYDVVVSGSEQKKLVNILIGEVWLCSGQSNMAMPIVGYNNQPVLGSIEALLEPNKNIRLFLTEKQASLKPEFNVKGEWKKSNTESVSNYSAVAYFFANTIQKNLSIPIGLIDNSWGGSNVEAWIDSQTLNKFQDVTIPTEIPEKRVNWAPTLLYNGMLHPFVGLKISGIIWYQGESNVGNAKEYKDMFSSMINSWRNQWDIGDFPFYFVQIAPYDYGRNNSAFLREAQLQTLQTVPNTGMAVTIDIGNCNGIHPSQKKIVGERLAFWALRKTYHFKGLPFSGPEYERMEIKRDHINLFFKYAEHGLSGFEKPIKNFEIAGSDHKFYSAEVIVNKNRSLTVSSPVVNHPVAVRYAFDNCSAGTLYNNMGLPASSFRTDNWKDYENIKY